ncbi:MAG: Fur family transcriptional regulator [Ostreibacterium sp.]
MKNSSLQHYCQQHDVKLTPLRQQVLSILTSNRQPLTAYALLDILKESNPKSQVMSVYRVLNFLQQKGLVHRIENLNAFMACNHLAERHSSQWLICQQCGKAEECILSAFRQGIEQLESETGFHVTIPTIELLGFCKHCKNHQLIKDNI